MTSIYDIPYEDIKEFLLANNKIFNNENDAYKKALILLKDKNSIGHTTSIIEWMIAHNLLVKKVNIPNFTIYQINNMKEFEVTELSRLLGMQGNDRNNVKNILKYLGKLNFLPEHSDVKPLILNTILELQILSSDLYMIINIFKNNKFLRKFIYDNMVKIISNNIVNKRPGKITKNNARYLAHFIFELMKLNEMGLMKEAIRVANKYEVNQEDEDHPLPKIIKYLTYNVLVSLDVDLIIKYFDLFDYINSVYKNEIWEMVISDYSIVSALSDPEDELSDYQMKFLPSIFEAALIKDKRSILKAIYHFWWFEEDKITKYNREFLKQINPLIKQFEIKYPEAKYP